MTTVAYVGNDNLIEVLGLQNEVSGAYIDDAGGATVTAVVKDLAGVTVDNADSITLAFVSASNGNWRGVLPDTAALKSGADYVAEITADGGAGLQAFWRLPFKAQDRTS